MDDQLNFQRKKPKRYKRRNNTDNFFFVPTGGCIDPRRAHGAAEQKILLLVYGGGSIKRIGLFMIRSSRSTKGAGIEYVELSGVEPNPRITSVRRGVSSAASTL